MGEIVMEPLKFVCKGIKDGGKFPVEYTGRGKDASPEFIIENLSPDAKSLAITLEDLSHPIKEFTHWVIWNIPAGKTVRGAIPAGKTVPALENARQGLGYGFRRYAGPKPPRGKTHLYRFTLYTLDCEIDLGASAGKKRFLREAENHIVQKGHLTAEFE